MAADRSLHSHSPAAAGLSRRQLLIAGGAGAGLIAGFVLWPRTYAPLVPHTSAERVFNPLVKIATNNVVTVIVPQTDYGQGVGTAFAQIVADELGADWSQMALQPALIHPDYGNPLILDANADPADYQHSPMATGGATSVRAFEMRLREAAAAARIVLQMAAAGRWGGDWQDMTTSTGAVRAGRNSALFGALADDAAKFTPPNRLLFRTVPPATRLYGAAPPRLDAPAKVDGSLLYAADIRLQDMVYAAVRQAPEGHSTLKSVDRKATSRSEDIIAIVEQPRWVAVAAKNWWAANTALDSLVPLFANSGPLADSLHAGGALKAALATRGQAIVRRSNIADEPQTGDVFTAEYEADAACPAPLELPAATAQYQDGRWHIWSATQAPGACRAAVASALGVAEDRVILFPCPAGGAFGAGFAHDAPIQAALAAKQIGRPVQLQWSRAEAHMHGAVRPPARARLTGVLDQAGALKTLQMAIAAPAIRGPWQTRALDGGDALQAQQRQAKKDAWAVSGAAIDYAIANLAVDHHPAAIGLPLTRMRGETDGYACFFREAFLDELAERGKTDPLSFRMALLHKQPMLMRCLSTAAMLGGWQGGASKSPGEGLALHSMDNSHIAVMVRAAPTARGLRVERIIAAVDVGRMVNPDLVLQQIEGGLLFGMAAALGGSTRFTGGLGDARRIEALRLPILAQSPEIIVELITSDRPPGGASQIAVPPVAPALAGAYYAATGRRIRRLPFSLRPVV